MSDQDTGDLKNPDQDQPDLSVNEDASALHTQYLSQVSLLQQQNDMLLQRVMNLNGVLLNLNNRVEQQEKTLISEIKNLQTGGAQRAMAGVYHKLFKDIIQHINNMDDLVGDPGSEDLSEADAAWVRSIEVLRDGLIAILSEWGLVSMQIEVGQDQFDPEIHEAVEALQTDLPADAVENVIYGVSRRGWLLGETILQYPQVLVG